MLRIVLLIYFSFLFSFFSYGQINILLPENPIINSILPEWKGHNYSANSNISESQTTEFIDAFSKLDSGILRWPGGNSGNNYRWKENLNKTGKLNLKNLIPFLNNFNLEPQIVVNFGNGTAEEAAEFVNFCNNQNTYYTQLRDSLLNNPNPINVKYWEIGNESTDAWTYGYSWLGFKDSIHFQTGIPDKISTQREADSLYYYGGSLFREGWIDIVGQLDKTNAILGDLKYYDNNQTTDTIIVKYPSLNLADSNAVRVYKTAHFDYSWGKDIATQQELYDSIANPANLLSLEEFSWNQTKVILTPNNGIDSTDVVLIEYNSINHDGAFAFRNLMKATDSSIEIGYNVKPHQDLASTVLFQQDFATSPPNFMIKHPYAGGLVIPLIENNLFSEAAYISEHKVSTTFVNFQQLWNQREIDWNIPNEIGLSLTEWNVALYDDADTNHPIRGITCGLYVADFWARIFEYALNDSLNLKTVNHFALAAQGNNFIHLLHTNEVFSVSTEGQATTMVMKTLGQGIFPITVSNNPQIDLIIDNQAISIDAVSIWGGIGANEEYINLLLINRDDENVQSIDVFIPATWQTDSVIFQSLYGTMVDETVFSNYDEQELLGNTYSVQIPAFSVNTIKIHLTEPLNLSKYDEFADVYIYPNPTSNTFSIDLKNEVLEKATIYNQLGQKVKEVTTNEVNISNLSNGIYFVKIIAQSGNAATKKVVKN